MFRRITAFAVMSLIAGILIILYGLHHGGERGIVLVIIGSAALLCLVVMVVALAVSSRGRK